MVCVCVVGGGPAALTREREARLAALMRLVPEPTVSRLLDLWRKGGLAERVDLGKVTELEMADGTKVWRIAVSGAQKGEEDRDGAARLLTGFHATDVEAVRSIFRSGQFVGRSYAQGGAGEHGLYVTGTLWGDDRQEILRCLRKSLLHSKNSTNVLFEVAAHARWERVRSGGVEMVQKACAQGLAANTGEYWCFPFKRLRCAAFLGLGGHP